MDLRLTILEVVNSDRLRIYRNEYFPFIQALMREQGIPCSWLSVGVEARTAANGTNLYLYDLPESALNAACKGLTDAAPTHVLLNERVKEETFERLQRAVPSARFHLIELSPSSSLPEQVEAWMGLDLSFLRGEGRLLEEAVVPDFERIPLNDLARSIRPYPSLLVGPSCAWSRPLSRNADFAPLTADVRGHRGCSFCQIPDPSLSTPRIDPVELAMRQLTGAASTLDPTLQDRSFLVRGVNLLAAVDRFAQALDEASTAPATFFVSTRIDDLLRAEERLRAALPLLGRRGHRIHIWNMGVENHSPRENLRFNKGLSAELLRRGEVVVRDLADAFPDTFVFDDWGYILYTPWTTPEDLRLNFRELSSRHRGQSQFALGTALQLLPGLPLTELAEHDGLVVEAFDDLPTDSGCITTWDGYEVPWRFRDERVSRMYRLTRRFLPRGIIPKDDALLAMVHGWLDSLPTEMRQNLVVVAEALLDVIEDAEIIAGEAEQLDAARQLLETRSAPPAQTPTHATGSGSPELMRLFDLLRSACDEGVIPLGAYRVDGLRVRDTDSGGRIELTLSTLSGGGPAPLEVLLERSQEDSPAFLRIGDLALSYKSREPDPTEEELDALRALLTTASGGEED